MKIFALKNLSLLTLAATLTACNLPPSPDFVEPAMMDKPMMDKPMMDKPMMDKPMMEGRAYQFEVTLEAPADAPGPLSPGVFVIHDSGMPLFTANAKDRGLGLEGIAEDGSPTKAVEMIPGAVAFNTPVGDSMPGPATPGKKYSFTFTAKPGDKLSFATMHVQSNDAFYAPSDSGIPLFVGDTPISGDMTAKVMLWDSGTEVNQVPGEGVDQAPRQSGPNTGASESETIQLISARDNFTYGNNIKLTITPVQEFEVTLEAPADAPGPLSPGVFVIHDSGMPLFTANAKDRGLGLEGIAEDGSPTKAVEMIPGAVAFNTPVGDSMPGPATPGKKYSFTFTAKPGDKLSFATMHVQSNDAFYAPSDSGIPLFVGDTPISGDMTAKVMLWDSGTEVNQPPGEGTDQAPRQSGPNTGASESEPIQLISARDNFTYGNNIQLTITPKK